MAIDAPDARVIGVPEIRETRRALAQRELEGRHRQQLRAHPQDLQQIARRGVDRHDAIAEAVGEERRFGLVGSRGHGCHKGDLRWSRLAVQRPDHERPRSADARNPHGVRQFTRIGQKLAAVRTFLQPCRSVCVSVINFLCFGPEDGMKKSVSGVLGARRRGRRASARRREREDRLRGHQQDQTAGDERADLAGHGDLELADRRATVRG